MIMSRILDTRRARFDAASALCAMMRQGAADYDRRVVEAIKANATTAGNQPASDSQAAESEGTEQS